MATTTAMTTASRQMKSRGNNGSGDDGPAAPRWNTAFLPQRLGCDALSAWCAGGLVAPVITVIDRGIMENASGAARLKDSVKASFWRLAVQPRAFFLSKPFGLVFMLYSSTYLAANTLDTFSSTVHSHPPTTVTAGPSKFFLTSGTNMTLCLFKDRTFARLFATIPARTVPLPTYALFAARDSITIFASFNLPSLVAPVLPMSEEYVRRADVAQFVCPAAAQVASTPLHLWGLDLYNRSGDVAWRERVGKVVKDWGVSCVARILRILPAFGVGGVVNTRVRRSLMGRLEEG